MRSVWEMTFPQDFREQIRDFLQSMEDKGAWESMAEADGHTMELSVHAVRRALTQIMQNSPVFSISPEYAEKILGALAYEASQLHDQGGYYKTEMADLCHLLEEKLEPCFARTDKARANYKHLISKPRALTFSDPMRDKASLLIKRLNKMRDDINHFSKDRATHTTRDDELYSLAGNAIQLLELIEQSNQPYGFFCATSNDAVAKLKELDYIAHELKTKGEFQPLLTYLEFHKNEFAHHMMESEKSAKEEWRSVEGREAG